MGASLGIVALWQRRIVQSMAVERRRRLQQRRLHQRKYCVLLHRPIRPGKQLTRERKRVRMNIALLSEVFTDATIAESALLDRLTAAKRGGAEMVVLPEIPLHAWSPATAVPNPDDAEPWEDGPRFNVLKRCAVEARVYLVASIIVKLNASAVNRCIVLSPSGEVVYSYDKLHLPDEDGFREPAHYGVGNTPPVACVVNGLRVGVLLCSDLMRPSIALAMRCDVLIHPRATSPTLLHQWRIVMQAIAITGCCYVLSVTRPSSETVNNTFVNLGGPSIVVDPAGDVLCESADSLTEVTVSRDVLCAARMDYPGYVAMRPELYANAWLANA